MAVCAECEHPVVEHKTRGCLHEMPERESGLCPCLKEWEPILGRFMGKMKPDLVLSPPPCDTCRGMVAGQCRVCGRIKNSEAPIIARDSQVGGNHYRQFKIQPWDVIDEYGLDFYRGNVVKYLLRAGHKGVKLEDLKKARHYLDRVIEIEEGK